MTHAISPSTPSRRHRAVFRETALLRLTRRAMATHFEIVLPYDSDAASPTVKPPSICSINWKTSLPSTVNTAKSAGSTAPPSMRRAVEGGLFDCCEKRRGSRKKQKRLRRDGRRPHQDVGLLPGTARLRPTPNVRRPSNGSGCGMWCWRRSVGRSRSSGAAWKSTWGPSARDRRWIGWAIFSPRPENSPEPCCTAAIAACTLGEVRTMIHEAGG